LTETVDEGATTRLNEFWVEFSMTPQQIEQETGDPSEMGYSTAVTLATRAANILAQAEDLVIFQGQNAIESTDPNSLFKTTVRSRGEPGDPGLLDLTVPGQTQPPLLPPVQVEKVQPLDPSTPGIYGENSFGAVAKAYADLQGNGQYGPYASVFH